eukprot:10157539-Alexandrium_andersonii.AAC.1
MARGLSIARIGVLDLGSAGKVRISVQSWQKARVVMLAQLAESVARWKIVQARDLRLQSAVPIPMLVMP